VASGETDKVNDRVSDEVIPEGLRAQSLRRSLPSLTLSPSLRRALAVGVTEEETDEVNDKVTATK